MASWYGTSRSNYFRVLDENAFVRRMLFLGVEWNFDGKDRYMIYPDDRNEGGWPTELQIEETEEYPDGIMEFDIAEEVREHLVPGEIALLGSVGAEKLRYLTAEVVIVTKDNIEYRNLIEEMYADLVGKGLTVTRMEY